MKEQLLYTVMLLSILISALCSVLEATLLSTPLSFITGLEEQGRKGAQRLKKLKLNTDRPISAILCLNTIANTVGASIVGSLVFEVYGDAMVGIFSAVFTLLILFFSEIIPKTIGSNFWRTLAIPASGIINAMIVIAFPLVWILEKVQRLISSHSTQVSVSREDLSAMVSVATEEEVIEKEEKKIIQNLLKLDDIIAHEIMTPSVVVEMAEAGMTIKEFYQTEEYNAFSRIPIYDEDNDEYVIGYVLRQSVLEKMAEDNFLLTLRDIARPILTFSEDTSVGDIWEKLLEKKEHISAILDEYGSLRGIVTMEDVIETMLGQEIVDEKDEVVDMQEYAKEQWEKAQKEMIEEAVH
ncbi:MAG: CNNM domain-containing protein [Bacteroidales bacterium]|nr:CNNM domain-containing protein [Bacteroidales bacterium]MDE7128110.1 CNNM domain-containing protein [Bacteroidales bacterium]